MFDESSTVKILCLRMPSASYFIVMSIFLMNYRRTIAAEAPARRPSPFPLKVMPLDASPAPRRTSPRQPPPPPPPSSARIIPQPSIRKPSPQLASPPAQLSPVLRKQAPLSNFNPKQPTPGPPSPAPPFLQFRFPALLPIQTYRPPSPPLPSTRPPSISPARPLPRPLLRPLPRSASPTRPALSSSSPLSPPPKPHSPSPGPSNRPILVPSWNPSAGPPSPIPNLNNLPLTPRRGTTPPQRLSPPPAPCSPPPSPPKRWPPLLPPPRPLPQTSQPSLRPPRGVSPSPVSSPPTKSFSRPAPEQPRPAPSPRPLLPPTRSAATFPRDPQAQKPPSLTPPLAFIRAISPPTPTSSIPPPPPASPPSPPPSPPSSPPPSPPASPPPSPPSNRTPPPALAPFVGTPLLQLPTPPAPVQPRASPISVKDSPRHPAPRPRSPTSVSALLPASAFSDNDDIDQFPGGNCPDAPAVLDLTNLYRARHQAPPLTWDEQLAHDSTAYAKVLAAKNCQLRHMTYGENLMQETGYPKPGMSCISATQGWYSEVLMYDFNSRYPFQENWPRKTGHFSQLVWRSSSKIGCGAAIANLNFTLNGRLYGGGCKVIVCRYLQYGNVASDFEFLLNVRPNVSEIQL
ncbi:hypothetical protein Vafri_20700 [Volvox africanus]|uniref:SCP domain-containing protein n=1 Tax=Volvox africanus TaxID=51714 RepID=A0A8J4FDC8_9CHLO|nr:hypothetical protein Vafri_20700 [Volvox africanus]